MNKHVENLSVKKSMLVGVRLRQPIVDKAETLIYLGNIFILNQIYCGNIEQFIPYKYTDEIQALTNNNKRTCGVNPPDAFSVENIVVSNDL